MQTSKSGIKQDPCLLNYLKNSSLAKGELLTSSSATCNGLGSYHMRQNFMTKAVIWKKAAQDGLNSSSFNVD